MANLEFCDTHNMVAYLLKIEGSEGFHQTMDFLNTSHIKYALIKNPTIYVSPIQQFWQTAAANNLDTGEVQVTAIIDWKGPILQGQGSIVLVESHNTPIANKAASTCVDVRHGGAVTIVTSLDARQGSVESLEADLKQTKQVYGANYTKLIMKKFEDPFKLGRSMIEEIDQDAEVTLVTPTQVSTQGEAHSQPEDQSGVLSVAKVLADTAKVHTYTRKRRAVNTGSGGISTASRLFRTAEESVSTASASMPVSTTDKKRQQEQERLSLEAVVRLQEQFNEKERQRIAKVHEAAQTFTKEEWENIKARVKADEELTQRLQAEEKDKYSKVDQAKMLKLSFDEIKELFKATMRSINDVVLIESEDDKAVSKLAEAKSLKRDTEEELKHEGSKKQKTSKALGSAQEQPGEEEKELSQEDLQ
uniref:Xylulose kinase-1 n=1 Tax=Tanacetum cinerariifolium TaxID=118510 RepID=A0A6L2M5S2_TANCI|nr:hypothetical protein [Tanacetum cinerariifolium]